MADDTIGAKAKAASAKFHLESQLFTDFEQGINERSAVGHYTFTKSYHQDVVSLEQLDNFGVFMKSQGVRPVITKDQDRNNLIVEWTDMYIPIQKIHIVNQSPSSPANQGGGKVDNSEDQD